MELQRMPNGTPPRHQRWQEHSCGRAWPSRRRNPRPYRASGSPSGLRTGRMSSGNLALDRQTDHDTRRFHRDVAWTGAITMTECGRWWLSLVLQRISVPAAKKASQSNGKPAFAPQAGSSSVRTVDRAIPPHFNSLGKAGKNLSRVFSYF